MTITIDIPAIRDLANAINNLAESQRGPSLAQQQEEIRINQLRHEQRQAEIDSEPQVGGPSQPVTAANPVTTEAPPKRTRRTKAEMEEARRIESEKGRRVEEQALNTRPDTPETQAEDAAAEEVSQTPFTWTAELLVSTFVTSLRAQANSKAQEEGWRNELAEIRKAVDPNASALLTVKTEHYPELAKRFTAWFREKGIELQLPEGAE